MTIEQYQSIQLQLIHVLGHPKLFDVFQLMAAQTPSLGSDLASLFKAQGIDLGEGVSVKSEGADDVTLCVVLNNSFHCITIRNPVIVSGSGDPPPPPPPPPPSGSPAR